MQISKRTLKMCVIAGVAALSAFAGAGPIDGKISIGHALNSPTLTVKYSGAHAAMVELRVNGESLSTRSVEARDASGETTFPLDLAKLSSGDNEVEIRLFDKAGKMVGSEKTTITADDGAKAPVFLTAPKIGATVQGPVNIKVGFGQTFSNSYVSFFIDNQFKSMSNFPPFEYLWDSSRETNGWHEVEAWVVDQRSTTFKTKKVRIFVNNPSGHTERRLTPDQPAMPITIANPINPPSAPIRQVKHTSVPAIAVSHVLVSVTPIVMGVVQANPIRSNLTGKSAGLKPMPLGESVAMGQKQMTPTGARVAKSVVPMAPIMAAGTAAKTIAITKGQRLPNLGSFAVMYNQQYVKFDVSPRVQDGVPMTPFRHLIEKAGGKVQWENGNKAVNAKTEGREIYIQIGDKIARINDKKIEMELAPYLEKGRTIVPLSFIRDTLNVNIEYDKATGHVLITSIKK